MCLYLGTVLVYRAFVMLVVVLNMTFPLLFVNILL